MIEDDVFYTKTMAKVYEDQGQYEKAIRIYQYLLTREPERKDLSDALSELQKKSVANDREGLVRLFVQWLDLLIASNGLNRLKKLQKHLNYQR